MPISPAAFDKGKQTQAGHHLDLSLQAPILLLLAFPHFSFYISFFAPLLLLISSLRSLTLTVISFFHFHWQLIKKFAPAGPIISLGREDTSTLPMVCKGLYSLVARLQAAQEQPIIHL